MQLDNEGTTERGTGCNDPGLLGQVVNGILAGLQTMQPALYHQTINCCVDRPSTVECIQQLLCDDPMSPSYYIMGWQCVQSNKHMSEVFGPMHCAGGDDHGQACKIAHPHISVTETNYASTMWLFKIGTDGIPRVTIGKQSKNGCVILMGIGGKGGDDATDWKHLKLGLRETMLITAEREAHEEVGDVFAAGRWMICWVGSGGLGGKEWYLVDYSLIVKHEDKVSHREAPFSTCDEFIESGWYTAAEVRALVKESEDSIKAASAWDDMKLSHAGDANAISLLGERPTVIQSDRLEERIIAAANAQLPGEWPGPCIRCSTEAQRAEEHNRQQHVAFKEQ